MEIAPFISKEILAYLKARYPDRCPDLHLSDREYGAYFGARQLIRHLDGLFTEQNGLAVEDEPVTTNRTRRNSRAR